MLVTYFGDYAGLFMVKVGIQHHKKIQILYWICCILIYFDGLIMVLF